MSDICMRNDYETRYFMGDLRLHKSCHCKTQLWISTLHYISTYTDYLKVKNNYKLRNINKFPHENKQGFPYLYQCNTKTYMLLFVFRKVKFIISNIHDQIK